MHSYLSGVEPYIEQREDLLSTREMHVVKCLAGVVGPDDLSMSLAVIWFWEIKSRLNKEQNSRNEITAFL